VDDGLGPEISAEDAQAYVNAWAESIADGRLLLFLRSVQEVAVCQWNEGEPEPKVIAKVTKQSKIEGNAPAFERLPREFKLDTFKDLVAHIEHLNEETIEELSKPHITFATTRVEGTNVTQLSTPWMIVQQFSANNSKLLGLMQKCTAIPVVGIAMQLCPEASRMNGAVYCFLPVGTMQTELPVHVNASFQVAKNRRSLWLKSSTELTGKHGQWIEWNEELLLTSLPDLWVHALFALHAQTTEHLDRDEGIRLYLGMLPDLGMVRAEWLPCAEAFYKRITLERVIPHLQDWVSPKEMSILKLPTGALKQQRDHLMRLYFQCSSTPTTTNPHVVSLPPAVETACEVHCGSKSIGIQDFLRLLLKIVPDVRDLSDTFMSLAEHVNDRDAVTWKEDVGDKPWVPLQGCVDDEGRVVCVPPSQAFDPTETTLRDFAVVKAATAVLPTEGVVCGCFV
jgi:hypothetical protein